MSPDLWRFALDVGTVACAGLIALRVMLAMPARPEGQLIALICVCTCCNVVLARAEYGPWMAPAFRIDVGGLGPLLNLARNLTPGLLMILVHRLFTERPWPPAWVLALFAIEIAIEGPVRWLGLSQAWLVREVAPTALQALFAGLALYWTLADWRADLVEERRRTRMLFTAMIAINVIASSVLLRVVIPWNTRANYDGHVALSLVTLATLVLLLLRLASSDLADYVQSPGPKPAAREARDDGPDLARLLALVEGEALYREPGLTLRDLAERFGAPEYRVRRLIHQGLGHRNFNAFLHCYRVKEACAQLADPGLRRTPITTIALTVGYQSLNTFNRGFREVMGVTPSAYRMTAQNLQSDPKT